MSYLQNFKYEISGPESAEKVVFLHGLLGSAANWRRVTRDLNDSYQTLAFDQRGHGASFKPSSGYSPEDYAQDLRQILDELRWDKVHLVGHSMGGRNAIRFANRFPERLHTLTVEDIGPSHETEGSDHTRKMIEMVPVPFENRRVAKDYFNGPFLDALKDFPQRQMMADFLFSNISMDQNGPVGWRFSLPGAIESVVEGRKTSWDDISSLRVPTLYLRGETSRDLSQVDFDKILSLNPIIEGHVVAGSSHWIHFEQVFEFIRLLRNFLSRHSPK